MKKIIKIGIVGFGNLGKGVLLAVQQNPDMELVAIFTRRNPTTLEVDAEVASYKNMAAYKNKIDVMILCGGSAKDLPIQAPEIAAYFNTVDSFDNHHHIPTYFKAVDEAAERNNQLSLISTGWDPGLFSMMRLLGESVLPQGKTYTFWGKGLSQGHSDAIRRISGVKKGVQYTIPNKEALAEVKSGKFPDLKAEKMHNRVCYVVLEPNADAKQIENEIKTMPDYFAPYHTEVHFISEEEFNRDHQRMPHGGKVLRPGASGNQTQQFFEFSLALESNPEFTSSVLVAFARGVHRLAQEGKTGAISVFDMPLGYLSPKAMEELRRDLL